MRIAMVGSRGIPARCGGVECVLEALTAELAARGHEVLVYARPGYVAGLPAPPAGKVIATRGISTKHLDALTHTATAMVDLLRRDIDVVHIHSPGPSVWSWLPKAAGKPVVFTVHAPDWQRDKWSWPAKKLLELGLGMGMRLADAVTAISDPLADELSRRFGRQVHYVPNAPPQVVAAPSELLERWQLRPDRYALYVGRIVPEKRLDLLISAWGRGRPDVPLAVAGQVPSDAYGRHCRDLAEGLDVRFIGPRYAQELSALYGHAAMVIQPSVLEGMSMVLLEAAAHGRCVLAADIAANRVIGGEAILYYRCDDVASLAEQIHRCLAQDQLRSALGRAARDRVASLPQWPDVAGQMERIYLQVR